MPCSFVCIASDFRFNGFKQFGRRFSARQGSCPQVRGHHRQIFPERVFSAARRSSAIRNTGGRFADDFRSRGHGGQFRLLTSIREKYQAYLLNEVTLEIGSQTLKPGAYGFGFWGWQVCCDGHWRQ
jgi:hypothetical protein